MCVYGYLCGRNWVAVKDLKLSHCNEEALLCTITIYPYHRNLVSKT